MSITPIDQAITRAGSGVELAKILGVTPMAVSHWKARGVPAHQVLAIESATGVSRHTLRPDIYPEHLAPAIGNLQSFSEHEQSNESAVNPSSVQQGFT